VNREQLVHAIRTACEIIGADKVAIIGSQSILGSFDDEALPPEATISREIDILPFGSSHEDTQRLADQIEGAAGEYSPYDVLHGFYLDGVDETTAVLPVGWRDRLVAVESYSVVSRRTYVGLCLDPYDLCVAKLCANREKDLVFVQALISSGMLDLAKIAAALVGVTDSAHALAVSRAKKWVEAQSVPDASCSISPTTGMVVFGGTGPTLTSQDVADLIDEDT